MPKVELKPFTLRIPDAEGKIVRRVKVKVPVEWDEAIGEWMMTPESLRMVEEAKACEMRKPSPELLDDILWKIGVLAFLAVFILIELTK